MTTTGNYSPFLGKTCRTRVPKKQKTKTNSIRRNGKTQREEKERKKKKKKKKGTKDDELMGREGGGLK